MWHITECLKRIGTLTLTLSHNKMWERGKKFSSTTGRKASFPLNWEKSLLSPLSHSVVGKPLFTLSHILLWERGRVRVLVHLKDHRPRCVAAQACERKP